MGPTEGKDEMGKRFAIVIGLAAAGVMALGAQTAAAATYNTKVTIGKDRMSPSSTFIHGNVYSAVRKCEFGRRVAVFKQQPGADRKLGEVRSRVTKTYGHWDLSSFQAKTGWHVYARVRREVRPAIGLVCLHDRSPIYTVRAVYATKVTITQDRPSPHTFLHGEVISVRFRGGGGGRRARVRECEVGRRVAVFRQRPGTDRKLGEVRSSTGTRAAPPGVWGMKVPQAKAGWHVYARATRAVRRQGLVCLPRRSPIYTVR